MKIIFVISYNIFVLELNIVESSDKAFVSLFHYFFSSSLYTLLYLPLSQVTHIPWQQDALAPETGLIVGDLVELNKRGVLTINSQPRVNGVSSSDPVHGWGSSGGYVFQKVGGTP